MVKTRFSLLFLVLFISGCSLIQGIDLNSNEKKYLALRAELNIMLEQYILIQDRVNAEDHQKIKQAFIMADLALDTWERYIHIPSYDYTPDIQKWLQAKAIIMEVMEQWTLN